MLQRRFRENRSLWLPIASGLIFAITVTVGVSQTMLLSDQLKLSRTLQALATDMDTAFRAYAIHDDGRPDPVTVYTHSASPVSLAKNAVIVIMSIISDAIIVRSSHPSMAACVALTSFIGLPHLRNLELHIQRCRDPDRPLAD